MLIVLEVLEVLLEPSRAAAGVSGHALMLLLLLLLLVVLKYWWCW